MFKVLSAVLLISILFVVSGCVTTSETEAYREYDIEQQETMPYEDDLTQG